MMDEPHADETQPDQAVTKGEEENFGATRIVPEPGTDDPGTDGEDEDILGKSQADLTADDLKGDARSRDVE